MRAVGFDPAQRGGLVNGGTFEAWRVEAAYRRMRRHIFKQLGDADL